MARRERVMRMSVEQPLWRALTAYRVLTMLYAIGLFVAAHDKLDRPWVAIAYYAVLAPWTLATLPRVANAASCTRRFLVADLTLAIVGILLTPLADSHQRIVDGGPTLPSIWTAGAVLAYAIKGGWRWAAFASLLVGVANVVQRGAFSRDTVHNVLLVCIASIAIGYVVEVARASERTLARALEIEAATRERERLARDIHDSVLQVLAMVQRRGTAIGGEAAELGRLAGEQEVALRTLVAGGLVRPSYVSEDASQGALVRAVEVPDDEDDDTAPCDLRTLLAPHVGSRVTLSEPGAPVLLAPAAAKELAAAVSAALDNVRRHVGAHACAWILVEDEPDAVIVTVRDDGPGIPEGR
uniref:MacS family sensor histidine kinase n=1 Tax=Streptomyces silaceus TaxID=545123 RepID=UPI0006EB8E85